MSYLKFSQGKSSLLCNTLPGRRNSLQLGTSNSSTLHGRMLSRNFNLEEEWNEFCVSSTIHIYFHLHVLDRQPLKMLLWMDSGAIGVLGGSDCREWVYVDPWRKRVGSTPLKSEKLGGKKRTLRFNRLGLNFYKAASAHSNNLCLW